ncbi:trophoblast glycoprotein-like [Bombina bombina]|uniref:trophoblast glycoprotein-like n=1 Tax=Bombina bombina TaxID=8345 RepID=UPI00235B1F70|nr:trophoblast glycoprotein-like [Bombina bombina]
MSRRHQDFHGNLITLLISTELNCFLIFKLIVLAILLNVSVCCPFECYCSVPSGLVQCQFLPLQEIPGEIPHWVQNLSVIGSNITKLRSEAFRSNGTNLTNLTTLFLTNDNIQTIEAFAFSGLTNLSILDLSYNFLNSIAEDAFVGQNQLSILKMNQALCGTAGTQLMDFQWISNLRNLKLLELTGNMLNTFPSIVVSLHNLRELKLGNNSIPNINAKTVSDLFTHRTLQVYLNPNPLVCDCKIKEFLFWVGNRSQVPDKKNLKCHSPSNLNGTFVTLLISKNLKCNNENLETASYVFFGIVLALIGVIFLMVLYLNRKGIKRWLNNFREACRDQMEGYHYRYEQDSDPRRCNVSTGI